MNLRRLVTLTNSSRWPVDSACTVISRAITGAEASEDAHVAEVAVCVGTRIQRDKKALWALLLTVHSDLEVEVRGAGPSCVAGPHKELAGGDDVADLDGVDSAAVAVDVARTI